MSLTNMLRLSYPESLVNQNEIPIDLHVNEINWH